MVARALGANSKKEREEAKVAAGSGYGRSGVVEATTMADERAGACEEEVSGGAARMAATAHGEGERSAPRVEEGGEKGRKKQKKLK